MPDEETVAWLIDVISIDYCVKGLNRIKVYLVPSTNKLVWTNHRSNVNFQEVVSPEVSKLNPAILNKKQGDQINFSPAKILEKRKIMSQKVYQAT